MIKLLHPKMRFEGWEPYGLFKRPADTRTVDELKGSIAAWARRVPEVKPILPELNSMNPKHLGLVADTIELSQKAATSYKDVDMLHAEEGLSFFNPLEKLMSVFPLVSKRNPNAMTFSQEVIDKTGKLMSKFYLKSAADLDFLMDAGVNEHYKMATPLVERMAGEALTTRMDGPFSRQEEFVGRVLSLVDKETDVKKIALLEDVYKNFENTGLKVFEMDEFVKSETPVNVVNENMKNLHKDLSALYGYGKIMDVNEYLAKDPNDLRLPYYELGSNKLHRMSFDDMLKNSRRIYSTQENIK